MRQMHLLATLTYDLIQIHFLKTRLYAKTPRELQSVHLHCFQADHSRESEFTKYSALDGNSALRSSCYRIGAAFTCCMSAVVATCKRARLKTCRSRVRPPPGIPSPRDLHSNSIQFKKTPKGPSTEAMPYAVPATLNKIG